MANFKTHRNVGVVGSVAATFGILTLLENFGIADVKSISPVIIFSMVFVGTIGSFLPDIDLNYSRPTKIITTFFYFIFLALNFVWLRYISINLFTFDKFIIDLISLGASFIVSAITTGIFMAFLHSKMKHRGLVHSIPFGFLFSIILYLMIEQIGTLHSLLISSLLFIGFIIHLLLDEVYSIDIRNRRIKKSFGTALKLIDKDNIKGTIILYILIIICLIIAIF